jgi:hypothetical protein
MTPNCDRTTNNARSYMRKRTLQLFTLGASRFRALDSRQQATAGGRLWNFDLPDI